MNDATLPKPLSSNSQTITFAREEWDAFVERLEDAEDIATVRRQNALRAEVGETEFNRRGYTSAEMDRILDGTSKLTIWRDRAGLTQQVLADAAGVSRSYLAEIESGDKPGSAAALRRIAAVLSLPMEMLVTEQRK